jgi:hypothetical protein
MVLNGWVVTWKLTRLSLAKTEVRLVVGIGGTSLETLAVTKVQEDKSF